ASMAFLIAAQEAVDYRRRGIVTSSISFFRTMGGAVGIGVLGAMFNILTAKETAKLKQLGVKPAELLDPHAHATLPKHVIAAAQQMIAGGLTWVFAAMLLGVLVLWAVTWLMPARTTSHQISAAEAMESI